MKGFPAKWQDDPDELYEIKKVWPNCTPLAESLMPKKEDDKHTCIWVNTYGSGRVYNNALGHDTEAMADPNLQAWMVRGIEWAATGAADPNVK